MVKTLMVRSNMSDDVLKSPPNTPLYLISIEFSPKQNKLHAQTLHGQTFFIRTVLFQKITRKQKTFTECLNFIQTIQTLFTLKET